MDQQNSKNKVWSIWGWGLLIGSILLSGSVLRDTPQQNVSWERSAEALGKPHFLQDGGGLSANLDLPRCLAEHSQETFC